MYVMLPVIFTDDLAADFSNFLGIIPVWFKKLGHSASFQIHTYLLIIRYFPIKYLKLRNLWS